jgi:hypothetical protein
VALSTRGKTVLSVLAAVVVLGGGVVGYLLFTGKTDAIPFLGGSRVPAECPLTGKAIFSYSGGIQRVKKFVARSPLQDISQDVAPDLYTLDPNRGAPHNVYSDTETLRSGAKVKRDAPEAVFEYDDEKPERQGSERGREVHLEFSVSSDVYWRYRGGQDRYVRFHGETPHTLEDGEQVSAANVVVLGVKLRDTGIVDAAGNPSPEVVAVGYGKAWVFRNGRLVEGEWRRATEGDVMEIVDADGDVVPLAPGTTWVELFPSDLTVEVG